MSVISLCYRRKMANMAGPDFNLAIALAECQGGHCGGHDGFWHLAGDCVLKSRKSR
jgi:hypothetical protein